MPSTPVGSPKQEGDDVTDELGVSGQPMRYTDWIYKRPCVHMTITLGVVLLLIVIHFMVTPMQINDIGNFYSRSDRFAEESDAVLQLVTSDAHEKRTQPQQSEVVSTFFLMVFDGEDEKDGNILTPYHLKSLFDLEQSIRDHEGFDKYCFRGPTDSCLPFQSIINLQQHGIDFGLDDQGNTDQEKIDAAAAALAQQPKLVDLLDTKFGPSNLRSTGTRIYVHYGGPLEGFNNINEREDCEKESDRDQCKFKEGEESAKNQRMMLDSWAAGLSSPLKAVQKDRSDSNIYYIGVGVTGAEINAEVAEDLTWFASAVGLVLIFMWLQTSSIWLSAMATIHVVLSFPLAWFFYGTVCRFLIMTQMNMLALFIVLALGADDVFVFTDAWKQCAHERPDLVSQPNRRLAWTFRRSVKAMFVTSITTTIAFFSTAINDMPSVVALGVFTGFCVICNFALICTWYPAVIVIWHKQGWDERWCCQAKKEPSDGQSVVVVSEYAKPVHPTTSSPDTDSTGVAGVSGTDVEAGRSSSSGLQRSHSLRREGSIHVAAGIDIKDRGDTDRMRVVERFYHQHYAAFVYRWRYVTLGVTLALVAVFIGFASQIAVMDEPPSFFDSEHITNKFFRLVKETFPADPVRKPSQVFLVWGVDGIDRSGIDMNDQQETGVPTFDPDFDPTDPDVQRHIRAVCDLARSEEYSDIVLNGQVACFMDSFAEWLANTTSKTFPVSGTGIGPSLAEFIADRGVPWGGGQSSEALNFEQQIGFGSENRIKWWRVAINSTMPIDSPPMALLWEQRDRWEEFEAAANSLPSAGAGGNQMFQTSFVWTLVSTTKALVSSTLIGVIVSLCLAFVVLVVSTQNWIVAASASFTVACIVCCVIGFVVMAGWDLDIPESLSLMVLVGLSVDYVVHFANSYREAHHSPQLTVHEARFHKVRAALTELGVSILGGAGTTMAVTCFLFPATLLLLRKFGYIVVMSTVMAVLLSHTLFMAMLCIFGPTHGTGDLDFVGWYQKFTGKGNAGKSGSRTSDPTGTEMGKLGNPVSDTTSQVSTAIGSVPPVGTSPYTNPYNPQPIPASTLGQA